MATSKDARWTPFAGLTSDISTERSEYQIIDPVAGVLSPAGGTVEFQVNSSAGSIDLSQSYVLTTITMYQDNAGAVIKAFRDNEAPEEAMGDALWSNLDCYINGVSVGDSAPSLYPYSSFYRNALTKDAQWATGGIIRYAAAKNEDAVGESIGSDQNITALTEMRCQLATTSAAGWGAQHQGYALDARSTGSGATVFSGGGANIGPVAETPLQSPALAFRQSLVASANAASVTHVKGQYITTPNLGIWRQTAYLPGDIDLRLVLTKSADKFCIHGAEVGTAKIAWDVPGACSSRLYLKRVYPTDATKEYVEALSIERPFRFNTTMARAQKTSIGLSTSVDVTGLLTGVRPDTVVIQFVNTDASNGQYNRNPFASTDVVQKSVAQNAAAVNTWGTQGDIVSSIYIVWGGRSYPMRPMLASSLDDSSEAYMAYVAACSGGHFSERTPMLSAESFRGGRKLFVFQLNGDQSLAGSAPFDLSDRGSLEVHAVLTRKAFTENTSMICVGFHAAAVEIDKTRSVRKEGF